MSSLTAVALSVCAVASFGAVVLVVTAVRLGALSDRKLEEMEIER